MNLDGLPLIAKKEKVDIQKDQEVEAPCLNLDGKTYQIVNLSSLYCFLFILSILIFYAKCLVKKFHLKRCSTFHAPKYVSAQIPNLK